MELAKMRPVDGAARMSTTVRVMYTTEKTSSQALDCISSPFVTTACRNASLTPKNQRQKNHQNLVQRNKTKDN